MNWNFFSFFLNNEEALIELNSNILETNLINLLILFAILYSGGKSVVSKNLEDRRKLIVQTIQNAQQDVVNASAYYYLAEKGFSQSIFWLQCWRDLYEKQKLAIVNNKYKIVKASLLETFEISRKLITNFENKAFLSLQRYITILTVSRILRKFLSLSEIEKSNFIETTFLKLAESQPKKIIEEDEWENDD